jgi:fimbrial chaperone protein
MQLGLTMSSFLFLSTVRPVWRSSVITLLVACCTIPAAAGSFSVSPVRIFMAPRERATAITITNEGDEALVMQADLYSWMQKANGEDDLVLTEDMILSPPIIKIAPKSRQVVRLAMLRPRPPGEQLTYRMIVREIPEAKPANANVQLQIALAFSMPVFITPNGVKRNVVCTAERAADGLKASCENTGNAYAAPRSFVLTNAAGDKLASSEKGGYILPNIKRSFDLKSTAGKIPVGKAKLLMTHDDSTIQTFDVTVAE